MHAVRRAADDRLEACHCVLALAVRLNLVITTEFAGICLADYPLPATVFNRTVMAHGLGAARWQFLHRAVYVTAPLGVLHH